MHFSTGKRNFKHLSLSFRQSRREGRKHRVRLLGLEEMEPRVVLSTSTLAGVVDNVGGTPVNRDDLSTNGSDLVSPATVAQSKNANDMSILGTGALAIRSDSASASDPEVPAPTQTKIISMSPSPTQAGSLTTIKAQVFTDNPFPGLSYGEVEFFSDTLSIGRAKADSNGIATLSLTMFTPGHHVITARYHGGLYAASSAPPVDLTVTAGPTETTLSIQPPTPVQAGAPITLQAEVDSTIGPIGFVTGTMEFFSGTKSLGTAKVSGSFSNGKGGARLTVTDLPPGTYSISAKYSGDSNFLPSTSSASDVTILKVSATKLVVSPNPSVADQPVSLTATVSSGSPGTDTPTGTVTFYKGETAVGSAPLKNGVATFTSPALDLRGAPLSASYSGDSAFSRSQSSQVTAKVMGGTITALSSLQNPSLPGQSIVLIATVLPTILSPDSSETVPSGTVQLYNGSTLIGTATLVAKGGNAQATFTVSSLANVGTDVLTAKYLGDAGFNTSTSPIYVQNVIQASTQANLQTTNKTPSASTPVTFTVFVGPVAPANGNLTGNVVFTLNGNTIGSATVVNGKASFTVASLPPGDNVLTAVYRGNSNFAPSAAAIPIHVASPQQQGSATNPFLTRFTRFFPTQPMNRVLQRELLGSFRRFMRTARLMSGR